MDIHWEVNGKTYDFSMPGGGFASFQNLIEATGVSHPDEAGEGSGAATAADGAEVSDDTREFVANVESVVFSRPELVDVSKVENETTVGELKESRGQNVQYSDELTEEQIAEINAKTVKAGDWALISVQPFSSEESMTVTMKNGEQFAVKVTDEQISKRIITADGNTYTITVTYGPEAGIPENATLEAEEIEKNTSV